MKFYLNKYILLPLLAIFFVLQPANLHSSNSNSGLVSAFKSYISNFMSSFGYIDVEHQQYHKMYLNGYIGAIPQEVADLIMQLKDPQDYINMRVRLTKGLIFFGPPGSGKTELARCIAAEVHCPFVAANATDFKKPHIGEGSQAVTEVFERAREAARCHWSNTAILFVDEFDAVGTRVGGEYDAGRSEVINTLLNEMDGFNSHDDVHVIVIAATNWLREIDPALRRCGRFDYKVYIPYPDQEGRALFIEKFLQFYPSEATITPDDLIAYTAGMSPADMKFLFELAGRIAVRSKKSKRDMACFKEALYRMRIA